MAAPDPIRGSAAVLAPTGVQAAALDRDAILQGGVPGSALMEAAGRSAAEVLAKLHPEGDVVGVVGSGNNGGDALVLLRTLAAWGRSVKAVLVADRDRGRDERELLHGWPVERLSDRELGAPGWERIFSGAGVIVDGILGTGVRGAPRARQADAIRRVNAAPAPVLSIDLPSGSSAETGATPGATVDADVTVTFGGPKLGTLLHPARARAGRIVAVEIGFPPWSGRGLARVLTPAWARRRLPLRSPDTHKNAVGRMVVVAGGPALAGAAVLVVRSAFRVGAGYVRICSHERNRAVLMKNLPEAVFVPWDDEAELSEALRGSDAVALGPGLGLDEGARRVMELTLKALPPEVPAVVDADALNLVAAGRVDPSPLAGRAVLTPHAGEAARLLGWTKERIFTDRPAALRELVDRFSAAVLLKGAPSLVLEPGGAMLVDSRDSSALAVAGMGDALAGVVAALTPGSASSAEAAALGLHLTARAAAHSAKGIGVIPSDVVEYLPAALRETASAPTPPLFPFANYDVPAVPCV